MGVLDKSIKRLCGCWRRNFTARCRYKIR